MFYQPLILGKEPYSMRFVTLTNFAPHWHCEIEIVYCISGGFSAGISSNIYSVSPGEAVLISSMEEHSCTNVKDNTQILLIEFGYGLLGNDFFKLAEPGFVNPVCNLLTPDKNCSELSEIVQQLMQVNRSDDDFYSVEQLWLFRGYVYHIASILSRKLMSDRKSDPGRSTRFRSMMNMIDVIDYVEKNYTQDIRVEQAAEIAGYELCNFCRQFKKATNMGFHKYLNNFRINAACILLHETHYSVGEISERVGITHFKTFCRVFKQLIGMTPTEYRKLSRGAENELL